MDREQVREEIALFADAVGSELATVCLDASRAVVRARVKFQGSTPYTLQQEWRDRLEKAVNAFRRSGPNALTPDGLRSYKQILRGLADFGSLNGSADRLEAAIKLAEVLEEFLQIK